MEKNNTKKKTSVKKSATTKKSTSTKSTSSNKVSRKKTTEVKTTPKKATQKKAIKANTYKVKEEKLEKTLIFDGKENENLREVVENLSENNIVLEDKIVKRSKTRQNIIRMLSLLIVLIIIFNVIYIVVKYKDINKKYKTVDTNIYEKVKKQIEDGVEETDPSKTAYEHIEEINLSTLESKIINGENLNIMIFSSTCYACATFEPVIETVLEVQDKMIYKIDVTKLSKDEIDVLRVYYRYTKTPTIFTIRDGIVKSELVGAVSESDFGAWAEDNL